MLPAAFPAFLAQVADPAVSAQNPVFAYAVGAVIIGGIITVVTVADRIDSMVQRRRRQPSVDVDLVGLSAAIKTLTASVEELKTAKDNHSGHRERIAALETRCAELKTQLEREIATQRSYIAKNTHEIFERIEADSKETRTAIGTLTKTINTEFNTLYRALGKVEGITLEERG
jgi:hypothetical protein